MCTDAQLQLTSSSAFPVCAAGGERGNIFTDTNAYRKVVYCIVAELMVAVEYGSFKAVIYEVKV